MGSAIYYFINRITFNQSELCDKGYVNQGGTCLGIAVDWLHYSSNNNSKSYITDKYINKFTYEFGIKYNDPFGFDYQIDLVENLNSDNFYNRLNYYQQVGNAIKYKYGSTELNQNSCFDIQDKGVIAMYAEYYGHATAYEILNENGYYWFRYFDSNFGEITSDKYQSKQQVQYELYETIDFIRNDYYSEYYYVGTINDSSDYINCLKSSWKCDKEIIESFGTGNESMTYNEFCLNNDWHLVA